MTDAERMELAAVINGLPDRLQRYIHDIETRCDPAGEVRELFFAREQLAALTAEVERLTTKRHEQGEEIEAIDGLYRDAAESVTDWEQTDRGRAASQRRGHGTRRGRQAARG